MDDKTAKMAALNDQLRTGINPDLGTWLITQGIQALPETEQLAILGKVRRFDAFTEEDNPYGERDFGAFDHAGQEIFWNIDYYNLSQTCYSEDPSDPARTTRVLTVMLAWEI